MYELISEVVTYTAVTYASYMIYIVISGFYFNLPKDVPEKVKGCLFLEGEKVKHKKIKISRKWFLIVNDENEYTLYHRCFPHIPWDHFHSCKHYPRGKARKKFITIVGLLGHYTNDNTTDR